MRFQETLRRLAMIDEGFVTSEAGLGLGPATTLALDPRTAALLQVGAQGPYTDAFEVICCDCGDDPGLDYHEVSPRLQLVRGPYPIKDGLTAYETHLRLHRDGPRTEAGDQ